MIVLHLVRPAHQVVKGHLEIICQSDQSFKVGTMPAPLVVLIGSQSDSQVISYILLCQISFFPKGSQSFR